MIGLQRRVPDLARRSSIASAKGAIEVGQITEPRIERDRADGAIGKPRIAQHAMRAYQALVAHERGERESLVLEQLVDVSRCHALALRNLGDGQIPIAEMGSDG